jgi:hypothetical protein
MLFLQISSHIFLSCPPIMSTHFSTCLLITLWSPRSPYESQFLYSVLYLVSFSCWPGCCMPSLRLLIPWPFPNPDLLPPRPAKALPWLTCSFISNRFIFSGLLITLMMEAVWTSETLVNLYQPARHYNAEDSHLLLCADLFFFKYWKIGEFEWQKLFNTLYHGFRMM